jgi:septum formation protein
MISLGDKIIGKPNNATEATRMLKSFSGGSHYVITGAVVMDASNGRYISMFSKTKIYFKHLSKSVIKAYVDTKLPFDKAGRL